MGSTEDGNWPPPELALWGERGVLEGGRVFRGRWEGGRVFRGTWEGGRILEGDGREGREGGEKQNQVYTHRVEALAHSIISCDR